MGSRSVKNLCLLDTCAWIWITMGDSRITSKIQLILEKMDWLVSAISVWELAMLEAKKKIQLNCSIKHWVDEALVKVPGLTLAELSPEVSIMSCNLKDCQHSDPADRIIIATAIQHQAAIVTADVKIIDYCNAYQLPVIEI